MAIAHDKENVAPATSNDPLDHPSKSPSPKKGSRRGRSKSIGPGALEEDEAARQVAKDRRKSAFVPATKSILSKNEDSDKVARRKTMVNRRVSFAPEATLHTWDVIELARDQTTSTDSSSENTRRSSHFTRSSSNSPATSSDVDGPNSPKQAEDTSNRSRTVTQLRKARRSSGIPPMNFNDPDGLFSSGVSGGSDASESEGGEEEDDDDDDDDSDEDDVSGDDTGTAMSLDAEESTVGSVAESQESTSSSARLEAALQQAARAAGTRGIEFDEFGDLSVELAAQGVADVFDSSSQRDGVQSMGSASLDQENVNPFSPAFGASANEKPQGNYDELNDDNEASMDVTRAVGRIVKSRGTEPPSSPFAEETMEFTQAVGKITGQKRRRSTTEAGSPGVVEASVQQKRRRSSVARTSMGDDTMDLTMAVGGIQNTVSPKKPERRRSVGRRRSSGVISENGDASMDITRAVGGIRTNKTAEDESFDGNEDLSMELTTVMGGIKAGGSPAKAAAENDRPVTPYTATPTSPSAGNVTPKNQERFKDVPDLQAKKLLTPILEQEQELSHGKRSSSRAKPRTPKSPLSVSKLDSTALKAAVPAGDETEKGPTPTPPGSSTKRPLGHPDLHAAERNASPKQAPTRRSQRGRNSNTEDETIQQQLDSQLQEPPMTLRQSPAKPPSHTATPDKSNSTEDARKLAESIKLMSTPRKETLRNVTPKKSNAAKPTSPAKMATPRGRTIAKEPSTIIPSPVRQLNEDLERIRMREETIEDVGLQDFLNKAGVRFMDLTTTKRRMTTAPTPSKLKNQGEPPNSTDSDDIDLESAVIAAACTVPELELYQHACHEIKRYTKEGKQTISALEATTSKDMPPLIQAYMHATSDRRAALDVQMREMKTYARFRSKEMWYAWRGQDLGELMRGLQKIGEGLIADDEILRRSESSLDQMLPSLVERQAGLQLEVSKLEETAFSVPEDEKEELESAREQLTSINAELVAKQQLLELLRREDQEQDVVAENLEESKAEFTAAIQEANRVREACRGVSTEEMATLKESVKQLEEIHGWSISSASSSPSTVTMTYRSQLQLFFHPAAFQQSDSVGNDEQPNAPISLSYIADSLSHNKRPLTTSLRFFLQLLRASLHGLPQSTTKVSDLLAFIGNSWDTATIVAETERRLGIEALTDCRILGDERLAFESTILLTKVRSKVKVTFTVRAQVAENLELRATVTPRVEVVYGEQYNEKNMTEYLSGQVGGELEGWDAGMRLLREKLIARGAKGTRK